MKVIGVDVGGTFTDVILIDSKTGNQYVHKVPSIPHNQDRSVLTGIKEILSMNSLSPSDIGLIVHGTTVATNAMLERKGAKVVLLTTKGLEDILEIGRQQRDDIYALSPSRPEPLVARENRLGVNERLDFEGNEITELTMNEIERAIVALKEKNPESVAISFLFAYKNPQHEKKLLQEMQKEIDSYIVTSSEVLPEFREYERTSTAVLEAYLGPLVIGYLERLHRSLHTLAPSSHLTVMQSNGGTVLASQTRGRAIALAISGLAGGAIGGWEIAKQSAIDNAITIDMGGTSCDISAITGEIIVRPDNEIAGLPLRMPSVDVKTIGAGGGSIAWVDQVGILHVGPQSAGANPGPASYNKGGIDPTITDANVVLGRLNPDFFLGGKIKLNTKLAHRSISHVASKIQMSNEEVALGIIRISTENMVQAIREITIERGCDPRTFVLVAFGGAGPTQAADIAESLEIDRILVPPYPGITSAFGLICTGLRVDLMKTILVKADESNIEILKKTFDQLIHEAENNLIGQGAESDAIGMDLKIDMRYKGQSHELTIPIKRDTRNLLIESIGAFEESHFTSFGYKMRRREIEWVTTRVAARAKTEVKKPSAYTKKLKAQPIGKREVIISNDEKCIADIYRRNDLGIKQIINGPSIVEQVDTTTYIPTGWKCQQKSNGALWLGRHGDD